MPLPSAGGAGFRMASKKIIRFVRHGCTNRPFYHIVVMEARKGQHDWPIEQVGTYDPRPNMYNEKLTSLNLERISYWIGKGAHTSRPVAELLGHCGYFPIHPRFYMLAWQRRKAAEGQSQALQTETEKNVG